MTTGGSTRIGRRRPDGWRSGALLALVAASTLTVGCTDDPEPATAAELLEALEGRELSAVEETERLGVMELLCDLDEAVLVELWDRLDDEQLAFQDIAFGRTCPERNTLYAEETGRFATDE
ncbi:MAG: hypothetical protein ACRBI6_14850 [Acidimicrobiales bacterium]